MSYVPYRINKEIENIVNDIVPYGCHVLKTDNHIGCWVFCREKELNEYMAEIDIALIKHRERYSIYVLTESGR